MISPWSFTLVGVPVIAGVTFLDKICCESTSGCNPAFAAVEEGGHALSDDEIAAARA
jgi:hypothetical protein